MIACYFDGYLFYRRHAYNQIEKYQMNKLLRSAPLKIIGRNTQPVYNPESNDYKLRSWSQKLNTLASSASSRVYLGQLGALMNFYTKNVENVSKDIDWNDWKSRIVTDGLVDKVKSNYQVQSKEEYDLDRIFTEVFSKDSKAIDDINSQMAFQNAVWIDNYADYVFFLNDVHSVSAISDYNLVEQADMNPGLEEMGQSLVETNNFFPGACDDVNLYGYITEQFAWGKTLITFYAHPSDYNGANKASKNSMGR